jgi:hypothetical protein
MYIIDEKGQNTFGSVFQKAKELPSCREKSDSGGAPVNIRQYYTLIW